MGRKWKRRKPPKSFDVEPGLRERLEPAVTAFIERRSHKDQQSIRTRFRCFAYFVGAERDDWFRVMVWFLSLPEDGAVPLFREWQAWLKERYPPAIAVNFSSGYGPLSRELRERKLIRWELIDSRRYKTQQARARLSASCRELFDGWLAHLKRRRLATGTILSYDAVVRKFGQFLGERKLSITQVRYPQIREWLEAETGGGAIISRLARHATCLRSFFRWLRREGHIRENPMHLLDPIRESEKLPIYLEEPELEAYMKSVRTVRDRALVELLYSTGCHISELSAVDVKHVSFRRQTIALPKPWYKRGRPRVAIIANSRVLRTLERYLAHRKRALARCGRTQEAALFVNDHGYRASKPVMLHWMRVISRASPLGKRVTATVIRHSFGTHLRNRGADPRVLQAIMGHGTVTSALRYTKTARIPLKLDYEKAHPRA